VPGAGFSGCVPEIGILPSEIGGHHGVERRLERGAFTETQEIESVEPRRSNP
jgi:hypothetical protein